MAFMHANEMTVCSERSSHIKTILTPKGNRLESQFRASLQGHSAKNRLERVKVRRKIKLKSSCWRFVRE
jgi:hypothetical protein